MKRFTLVCFFLGFSVYVAHALILPTTISAESLSETIKVENISHEQLPFVRGIDVFGTEQVTAEHVRQQWGEQLIALAEAFHDGDSRTDVDLGALYEEVFMGIQAMGDFAYVNLSIITYFAAENYAYITVDFVDVEDVEDRMPFLPQPTGDFPDPDGLLQQWEDYSEIGFALAAGGELDNVEHEATVCPVLSCTFGFVHPELEPFLAVFAAGVSANQEHLIQILREDRDEWRRAHAAYLLTFTNDAADYVEWVTSSIRDSGSFVRNNVLRVLIDIAQDYPAIELPAELIVEALHYPDTTDRNKAAYLVVELAKQDRYRELLIEQAVPVLLEMLKLTQPNNHNPAYEILKTLSGKSYGRRDYTAWEQWAAGVQ